VFQWMFLGVNMQPRSLKLVISMFCLALFLSACKGSQPTPTPTTDIEALKNAAAQTASAFLTATALAVPNQTATPTTTATATQAPATPTPSQTLTPPPVGTITVTAGVSLGENAVFVADVTVPDGTTYKPGEVFTKTWRIKNAGNSTWTPGYALVFVSGDKLSAPDRMGLLSNVSPGGTVDISVSMAAPANAGSYRGFWRIKNTSGQFLGDTVYVDIKVAAGATSTVTSTSSGAVSASTATVTPTSTSSSATLSISNVSISANPTDFSGSCPQTYTFTGKFTLNIPASITYKLEAGSDDPSFVFTLPSAQTTNFGAGDQVVTYVLDFTNSVSGWVRLHISAPIDVSSSQTAFTLTCEP
jgi:hypothetical protein